MTTSHDFRVFLSAVSSEFGEARSLVASDLRARGIEVKVQEDFRQEAESETTLEKLHDYIRDCSAVVCVIGERSGSVPPKVAAAAYQKLLPDGLEQASYTQWELLFARHHSRRFSIYHAGAGYVPDKPEPTGEDDPQLQARFVDWLFEEQGLDRGTFSNPDALGRLVLREDWPRRSPQKKVVLPYPSLGDLFRGRKRFMDRLRESLESAEAAIACQVLHGLGGVGKTRLAVEYAWRFLDEYSAVLFVGGETAELLRQNLAALCGPAALDLPEKEAAEEAVQTAAAVTWLVEHPGWLLIVDNLNTPGAAEAAEDLLPQLRGGHVLLTGRLADWGAEIRALELDVLGEDEAVRFLLDRTDHRRRKLATDEADAAELARELGGLALALEQAGAYVVQLRCSLAQYLEDWRVGERGVRSWYDERVTNYPRSVAVTWQAIVDRLSLGELVLLRLLAWFAPEPVPLFVFEGDGARSIWEEAARLVGNEQDEEGGEVEPRAALSGLASYSMLRWDTNAEAVVVHRVVQEVVRGRLDEPVRSEWVRHGLRLLDVARPGHPQDARTWPKWDALRPHVALGVRFGEEAGAPEPTAGLMSELGLLLHAKALYAEAEPLIRRALKIDEASYGADHPSVARDLNNLSLLLQATNRLAEAEPLIRRALEIDKASFGADHPRVANDFNNLAQLLQATNRLAEAEPLMRRALEIDEASYGPDHPHVAIRLNNLAGLFRATNRLVEAEPLMRRALEINEASYGADHPRVAVQLGNLAQILKATNRLAEAEPLMRRALAIDEASYGADHPDVAIGLNNLAALLLATNRLAEAEPLMRRMAAIFFGLSRRVGHEHPHLEVALRNYARLLWEMGRTEEEVRAAIEVLKAEVAAEVPSGGDECTDP